MDSACRGVVRAAGEDWWIVDPRRATRFPEPVLSDGEVESLEIQMERWSSHNPGREIKALSREMVAAISMVKRVFRDGDQRAMIEEWA